MATWGDVKAHFKRYPALVAIKRTIHRHSRAIYRSPKEISYALIFTCAKAAMSLPLFESTRFRQTIFDLTNPEVLLIISGRNETFVVSPRDKEIGKNLYVHKEPYDFQKMQTIINLLPRFKPKTLIEVGANIGTICIPAVKRGIFENAIAIEPEPRNYALLMANIYLNAVSDRIVSYNLALGRKDDENVIFELSSNNFGDHRVRVESAIDLLGESTRETISVKSETFDKIITSVDANSTLIWIDTQGFEGHILLGAQNALRSRPPMCIEFWPYGMNRSKSYSVLKDALMKAGYSRFYDLNGIPSAMPLNDQWLDELYEKLGEKGAYTDLLVLTDGYGNC